MRIAPRLIILMFFILLALVLVNTVSNRFISLPDVYLFESGWLADEVLRTKKTLDAIPAAEQGIALENASEKYEWFDLTVIPKERFSPVLTHLPETLSKLQDELKNRIGGSVSPVVTSKHIYLDYSNRIKPLTVVVAKLPVSMEDELEDRGRGDVSISMDFSISVPLANGDWLVFRTKHGNLTLQPYLNLLLPPVVMIIIILVASIWTARSLLKPLFKLSAAAETLGRERTPTTIPEMVIPEYKKIADAFSKMQIQLSRFVDERTNMLAAISHDLRTLLTRTRLLSENLKDEHGKEQILSSLSDMEMMIKEYLIFAREDAAQEAYVKTDIVSLIVSICDTCQDAGYNVEYSGIQHAQLNCQPTAMKRAVTNVIENGCRYGESVRVELTDSTDSVTVTVKDKGMGIPPHLIEQAFLPFKRLDTSRNRDTGGTGLGLAIAKDIIHAHGGEIRLENAPEGGLVVSIILPKSDSAEK
ncbi:MAG: ATP-binding protein [Deferribacterales bacterium]